MTKPLVSIITPCYNGEAFLKRYFESILNQTYPNLELIFINDGSTDRTEEIALSYRERLEKRGITYIYEKQENAGQAAALNRGLKLFTGEYLTWPDSDDEMVSDAVEKKVDYLEQHPDYGFCICKTKVVNENNPEMKCGYYEYNPKNYDIVSFVENISMSVADFAKQTNIDLIFDTDVEEKIMAFDLEKLERIMLNLLSNSIKYNKAQGQIEVLLNDCNDTFVIRVKDTGVGIPSDKLMYIFERFRQVENTFNKSTKGSGIGLSLVKDLIEIQGGTIEVKSELGVGSEFIIKLPVKILSDDSNIDKVYFNNDYHDLVKRMNIEFSDIYIGND